MKKLVSVVAMCFAGAVALANAAVAQGASQRPQGRSGTTYYRNANGSSAGTSTTTSR